MFAVVNVEQCYDYVEGVDYLASFLSEQEANDFILEIKTNEQNFNKKLYDYIEKFVDDIVLPETDNYGKVEFLKQFPSFCSTSSLENFKLELKRYLRQNKPAKLKNYHPPKKQSKHYENLFVLEIKQPKLAEKV